MARADDKLWMTYEPLSEILGKTACFAACAVVLGGILLCRLVDWRWSLCGVSVIAALLARHYWRKYEFRARPPREGEFDTGGKRHGRWLWRFPDGTIGREAVFVHGSLHGTDVWYFPDGSKFQESHLVAGEFNGLSRQWNEHGDLDYEWEVRGNLAHGRCAYYWPDKTGDSSNAESHLPSSVEGQRGKLRREFFCDDGDQHGAFRNWHENGQLAEESVFVHGKPDGLATTWYFNGTQQSTGVYVSGERHGIWTWWHENGERWTRGEYKWGTRHGYFTEWTPDGTERQSSEYVAGYELGPARLPFGMDAASDKPGRMRWLFRALAILLVLAVVRDVHFSAPLVLLGMTIAVHELGHLLAAKAMGIPIKRFRVGVGPVFYRHRGRGTTYEWSLLPFLGFVEEYALRKTEWHHARAALRAGRKGLRVPEYPEIDPTEPREPGSRLVAPPRRLVYMLAGVTFNFLTAWLALWAYHAGQVAKPDGPSSVVRASQDMAHTTRACLGAISRELWAYCQTKTYTDYEPSILAFLQGGSRELFLQALDKSANDTAPKNQPVVTQDDQRKLGQPRPSPKLSSANIRSVLAEYVWKMLVLVFAIHLGIGLFNLLPIFPLDGYQCAATLLEVALGRYARYILRPVSIIGFLFLGVVLLGSTYLILRDLVMAAFW